MADDADMAFARAASLAEAEPAAALPIAQSLLARLPGQPDLLRLLGRIHRALGHDDAAEQAELAAIRASVDDPTLQQAARALVANELHVAEPLLRAQLKACPVDVAAIRMMAELAARIGRYRDAEALLRRAVELAPGFTAARANLATILHRQNRTTEALAELDRLHDADPGNAAHATLRAAVLGRVGEYEEAIALYREVLAQRPDQPKIWMSFGHALKTVGEQDEAIAAYRRGIAIDPTLGEIWWSLANLKTVRFAPADLDAMKQALQSSTLDDDDRLHLDFALGKALDDAGEHPAAFAHYASGNAIRRAQLGYDPDETSREVDATIARFTPDFIATHGGRGCPAPDPIFILGMPRAGSTLIEQILACHSQVEGTMELPDIPRLVAKAAGLAGGYPDRLDHLVADQLRQLGQDYLDATRVQRREGKAFFIDKLPNNWLHVGFIHLILPSARIIDARRHPLDCCFSNFRQHFARGQGFSYGLDDIGRYYADYVRLMAHIDAVLPGRVHRVIHEQLLDDPEGEVRALLAALDLPFEEACLDFHSNRRAVRTASSEQVRRPINRDGVGQWQPYAAMLEPLRAALGPILDSYPEVPPLCSFRNTA
ncbi:sulfotransferase [Sphingomonadaceae bacterium G21617-S1]|nr:sulfotransferase [Sphingomonadaceae bacterium G21617-S1]